MPMGSHDRATLERVEFEQREIRPKVSHEITPGT
jgi:hypothetical protein